MTESNINNNNNNSSTTSITSTTVSDDGGGLSDLQSLSHPISNSGFESINQSSSPGIRRLSIEHFKELRRHTNKQASFVNPEDLYITVIIQDHQELQSARSLTNYYSPSLTIREVLKKLGKKGGVFLEDGELECFGLFQMTVAPLIQVFGKKKDKQVAKKEELPKDKTLKQLGIKSNVSNTD